MEPIISSKTQMCRVCPNAINLIDLNLPENDFIIKNLDSFVFVEFDLLEQLPKYICDDCNSALNNALQFRSQVSDRIEEIKTLIEISMKPIKTEIIFQIEEVICDPSFEEQTIKEEVTEIIPPPAPSTSKPKKQAQNSAKLKLSKIFDKTCIYCKKNLSSYKEMVEHNKTHRECNLCSKTFSSFKAFRVHYKYVHLDVGESIPKFVCDICGKEFQRKKNIVMHMRSYHNGERNFPCDICNKAFFARSQLVKHRALHTDERPFVCRICSKDFKSMKGLTYHEQTHEETKNKDGKFNISKKKILGTYICTHCGKKSRGITALKIHERIHTNELPHECIVCNKKFRAPISLMIHKRIHTGEKPYQCDLCPAKFRVSHYLTTHKKSHGGNDVPKFFCNLCGMSTVYEKNLDTHLKTVHMQIKNFDCKTCSESFSKISLLKAHMMESHNLLKTYR